MLNIVKHNPAGNTLLYLKMNRYAKMGALRNFQTRKSGSRGLGHSGARVLAQRIGAQTLLSHATRSSCSSSPEKSPSRHCTYNVCNRLLYDGDILLSLEYTVVMKRVRRDAAMRTKTHPENIGEEIIFSDLDQLVVMVGQILL